MNNNHKVKQQEQNRFGKLSKNNIIDLVEISKPANTISTQKSIWAQFMGFCEEKG